MKLFLLTLIVGLIASIFLPYWVAAPIAFLFSWFMAATGKEAFFMSGLAILVAWLGFALYQSYSSESTIIIDRMADLFTGSANGIVMYLVTALIGFLLGSLGGLAGFQLKRMFN